MEEVSISEIEKTADVLEENDLLLISQYNKEDGSFDSAKIEGKNLKQKLPGLMVRMWNCHDAQLELPYEGRELLNNLTYQTENFTWWNSRNNTRTEVECETAIGPLVTNGCSLLYKRLESKDRYFHDWYNNSDFWFYAGSFDGADKYVYTVNYTSKRPNSVVTDSYCCSITTDSLDHTSSEYLTFTVNNINADKITNIIADKYTGTLSFQFEITNTEHPDYEYFKDKVWTFNKSFDDFTRSENPVSTGCKIDLGDIPDEKILVYEGKIKVEKDQTIKFKGHVDNFATIIINGVTLCDFVGYNEQEIDVEFTSTDNKLYYDFKLVITNYGTNGPGFENDYPMFQDLKMSVDNGTTWINISNESFDTNHQIFFLPPNCDNYYREAQELRDFGCCYKPGLLVKMWHSGFTVGEISAECNIDHNVVDQVEAKDYKIIGSIVTDTGTLRDATTYMNLDATDGCGILYYHAATRFDPSFFDWFNGKEWNFYAGGGDENQTQPIAYKQDPRDKKIIAYFGEIYLPKDQNVYFKGCVDNSLSIIIDDTYCQSDDDQHIPLKGIHYRSEESKLVYKFHSTYTGYHKFKLIACNCKTTTGGRVEDSEQLSCETVKISFDKVNWSKVTNEDIGRNVFFIPPNDRYNEIYKKAEESRDNIAAKKLPGMLIKMWAARMPGEAYETNNFNADVIDIIPPGTDKIVKATVYDDINYTANVERKLTVTQGCGILYKTSNDDYDANYYDPFNALKWNFSSSGNGSSENHKEKVVIYYTELFMHAGQLICFKGIPDDTISVLINDEYPVSSDGQLLKYITCIGNLSEHPYEYANYSAPDKIYRYTAKVTGYQNIRIISTNKGGPAGLSNDHNNTGFVMSFDGGTVWHQVSNESFDNPIFFIPDGEEYRQLWYDAERSRENNNHYIDFNDPSRVTCETNGSNSWVWTANDNGTFNLSIGGILSGTGANNLATVYAKMPTSRDWIEIDKVAPHNGTAGSWDSSYANVNISMQFRVSRGTKFRIDNLKDIKYDKCTVFRDLNFNDISTYNKDIRDFTVNFVAGYAGGGTIHTENFIPIGTSIGEVKPVLTPMRAATAQYTYSFKSWDTADNVIIDDDKTVTAQWNQEIREYTVRFLNNAGQLLSTQTIKYGNTPSYNGDTPVPQNADSHYNYSFAGWTPAISPVTQNIDYTATYNVTAKKYTITFVNNENTLLQSSQVDYNTIPAYNNSTPPIAENQNVYYNYSFAGWTPSISKVTGDATYKAVYNCLAKTYLIRFLNNGNTVLESKNWSYGSEPIYSNATPVAENQDSNYKYTFIGWTPAVHSVTGSQDYKATYNAIYDPPPPAPTKYWITFINSDGTQLQKSQFDEGSTPVFNGSTPYKSSDAQYNYTFTGWSPAIHAVNGDATYTAQYSAQLRSYTITFKNNGGAILQQRNMNYGTTPVYSGGTPSYQNPSISCSYTFTGWSPSVSAVTGNATYIAQYSIKLITHTVRFFRSRKLDGECYTVTVDHGTKVTPPDSTWNCLTGWTRLAWYSLDYYHDINSPITSDVDFYSTYYTSVTFTASLSLKDGSSTTKKFTEYELPVGLSINAAVSGTITHKASPNHTMQMDAYIGTSSAKKKNISEWPATITATSNNTFSVNEGACCEQTIESGYDTLYFYAKKKSSCTAAWSMNLTVTFYLN